MTLNLDILRDILVFVEANNSPQSGTPPFVVTDISDEVVGEHVRILIDERYIEGRVLMAGGIPRPDIRRMLQRGYDAVALVQDENSWIAARKHFAERGAAQTLGLLLEYLANESRAKTRRDND